LIAYTTDCVLINVIHSAHGKTEITVEMCVTMYLYRLIVIIITD